MPRKASEATQLRRAKSLIRSSQHWEKYLQAEIRERRRIGAMLANIAFNLSQRDGVEPELRAVLNGCREMWDGIKKTPLEG